MIANMTNETYDSAQQTNEQCPYHIVTFVLSKDLEITTLYQFKQKSTALVIYVKKTYIKQICNTAINNKNRITVDRGQEHTYRLWPTL